MGNEMGNSNTSGLQEEENSTTQDQEKSFQEAGRKDGAKGGNDIVSVAEGTDYLEKNNGLASDVPNETGDSPRLKQTTSGKEQEETEVHQPAESPKIEIESKEEGGETSETFWTEDSKDQNNPPGYVDDAQENHIVPVTEGKDYHEKKNVLAYDVPAERDSEETEVQSSVESPKSEVVKPNDEADGEASEIKPTSPSKDLKDDLKPPGLADGAEAENHDVVHLGEGKNYHVKEIDGLASNVPKGSKDPDHVINQISDERDQESQKVEVKSNNEADGETSDVQTTSPSKDATDPEILQESILEENLSRISDHQLEKQDSIKKGLSLDEGEKTATFDSISSSNDPEPQESVEQNFYQPELAAIHADLPVQDTNKSAQKIENIPGSNLTSTIEENGHPIDTNIPKDIGEVAVSGSDLKVDLKSNDLILKEMASEAVSYEETLEIKDGDEVSNGLREKTMMISEFFSGGGINCNGQLPAEINQIRSDSSKEEPAAISMDKSISSQLEVSDCMDLNAAKTSAREGSDYEENKANHCPTQSCEESLNGSNIEKINVSMPEVILIESEPENNEKRTSDYIACDSGSNNYFIKDAKMAEDCHVDEENTKDQNEASMEPCKDSQKEALMVSESGTVTTESSLMDSKTNEVSEEKETIEEPEETTRNSCDIVHDTEGGESLEECVTPTLPLEEKEAFLPTPPLSLAELHDSEQKHEKESQKIRSSNEFISELKEENFGQLFVTEASSFDSRNLMPETFVSVAQLAIDKPGQNISQNTPETAVIFAESDAPANHLSGQYAKVETPAFATDVNQTLECMERLSTESNPNISNIQAQMQKSPSFGLDLRIEARTEESDKTPLLYQDKTAIENFSSQADVSLGNPIAYCEYGEDKLLYQAMPVEEKVVTVERSDSEKLKTPFLGFLKEEKEAQIVVTPQRNDINTAAKKTNKELLNLSAKEVASTSPKSKEKRKPRSSLFTNCMCCTTVIN